MTTLVLALTFCYTGLRAEVSDPYAQVMMIFDELRYEQERNSYQKNQVDEGICPSKFFAQDFCTTKFFAQDFCFKKLER